MARRFGLKCGAWAGAGGMVPSASPSTALFYVQVTAFGEKAVRIFSGGQYSTIESGHVTDNES